MHHIHARREKEPDPRIVGTSAALGGVPPTTLCN